MVCSLFSVFDPSCKFVLLGLSLKWTSIFLVFLFMWQFWLSTSGFMVFYNVIVMFMKSFIGSVFGSSYKMYLLMSLSLFTYLLLVGELGMIPFTFTSSSHLAYNMALSVPLWLGGLMYLFGNFFIKGISHITPLGCPMVLIPFLVIIESVSLIIRPFSLAIRLMANTMAGHMVMVLISMVLSLYNFGLVLPVLIGFMFFEFGVVLVQAYVFTSLLCMYYSENN